MHQLEFETQMLLDLHHEDGLVILAKGLGIERLLLNLIKVHSDQGNLVLVIGTSSSEEEYFLEQLKQDGVTPLPKQVTADCSTNERYEVYMSGGVQFVTSRILVVDMLTERVPIDLITGIIVYRAHKTLESCQEAFILRLYRQKNKKGFIKGLSSNAVAFTQGFCQIQRIMRNLFVRKLFLWPRFHADVISSLDKHKPEVIELRIELTPSMQAIQMSILDIMNVCVRDLKKSNPTLDTDELSVENVVSKTFDKVLKFHLEPIWNQLGPKTRRLISDLKTLRTVLMYLTQYDCVTFYSLIKSIRESVHLNTQISDWLFLDAAETLFLQSKHRVFGAEEKPKRGKKESEELKDSKPKVLKFEESPKWLALSEILSEIKSEAGDKSYPDPVLILAEDDRTCNQLTEFLCSGSQALLYKQFKKIIIDKDGSGVPYLAATEEAEKARGQPRKHKTASEKSSKSTKRTKVDTSKEDSPLPESKAQEEEIINLDEGESSDILSSFMMFHPLRSSLNMQKLLPKLKPKYIILYDLDVCAVREIETYQALNEIHKMRVYFLMYEGSVEEQRYLTALRREKDAFEYLIKEKSIMVIPEERDGRNDYSAELTEEVDTSNVSSRKAGGAVKEKVQQKVIVDLREFRSELPSLIHRRGISVEPVTIEIGDYILTPEVCVERKSLNDLIGSLNSGRLYSQAQSMCRYYKRPVLLIEFSQNKAFSLQGKYFLSSEVSSNSVISKLILLTLHFPRLRILWCPSAFATAEIFELLKLGKDQPSVSEAKAVSESEQSQTMKYNAGPQDFLSLLPGVNSKNQGILMRKYASLFEIFNESLDGLTETLGNATQAKVLWEGIHEPVKPKEDGKLSKKK